MDRRLREDLLRADLDQRDGSYVAALVPAVGRLMRLWFRSEVRDMDRVPAEGGALVVSNHSGGLMPVDAPIIAAAFVEEFGPHRPLYLPAHAALLDGPAGAFVRRCGLVPDGSRHTDAALASGAVAVVFPGGRYDATRPTRRGHVVDFAGSTDYVRTALAHGVPIVPVVSIGGQEAQLHLSRGALLARVPGLASRLRSPYLPVTVGVPFGLSVGLPPNLPLPTKITTQVLDPVDPSALDGVDRVDALVRGRMQEALDELRRQRRFPVLG